MESIRLWNDSVWQDGLDASNSNIDKREGDIISANMYIKKDIMSKKSYFYNIGGGLTTAFRKMGVAPYTMRQANTSITI